MNFLFESMSECHEKDVMDIFNSYVENGFSAYPENKLPYGFYRRFLEMTRDYPAYVIKDEEGGTAGFGFLHAYNPFPAFKAAAEFSCFISEKYTGKGVGKQVLAKLETEARQRGIEIILSNICSKNLQSIQFHLRNGFLECGRFAGVGRKMGQTFDVIWMQKGL